MTNLIHVIGLPYSPAYKATLLKSSFTDKDLSEQTIFSYLDHIFIFLTELQSKLLEAELALDEAQRLANAERTRRRTLHNTLMVFRVDMFPLLLDDKI